MSVFFNAMLLKSSGIASIIENIQEFSITITAGNLSNTATLTAFNTSRSVQLHSGEVTNAASAALNSRVRTRLTITNGTTITATRTNSNDDVTVYGVLWELKAAACVSAQTGNIALGSGVTSNTATVSSVSTSNAFLVWAGCDTTSTGNTMTRVLTSIELTNATTITATRNNGTSSTNNISYALLELTPGIIKSIQKIAATQATSGTTLDATISAVTTANTVVFWNGMTTALGTGDSESSAYYQQLQSTTNVRFTRTGTSTTTRTLYATVVEFNTGYVKTKEAAAPAFTASDTQIDTGGATVVASKTLISFGGRAPGSLLAPDSGTCAIYSTSTSNTRARRNTASGTLTGAYERLEFN